MTSIFTRGALGAAALALASTCAHAHAVLERAEARANAPYRAVVQITHGCKGSPTTSLTVSIPDGARGARPLVKPGWTIVTKRGLATDGVREITWSGGKVPDDEFDEFVFTVRLANDLAPGSTLYFPVVQTCEAGSNDWVQIPVAGQDASALAGPAPALRILAAAPSDAPLSTSFKVGALTIDQPWIRSTLPGAKVAAGYLRIANDGATPDRLLSAAIPNAARGDVHEMKRDGDVMTMRSVDGGLEIGAGRSIELKPGGLHLMFVDLTAGMKEGDTVRGSLTFAKAGAVPVTFRVGGFGAQAPAAEHMH